MRLLHCYTHYSQSIRIIHNFLSIIMYLRKNIVSQLSWCLKINLFALIVRLWYPNLFVTNLIEYYNIDIKLFTTLSNTSTGVHYYQPNKMRAVKKYFNYYVDGINFIQKLYLVKEDLIASTKEHEYILLKWEKTYKKLAGLKHVSLYTAVHAKYDTYEYSIFFWISLRVYHLFL